MPRPKFDDYSLLEKYTLAFLGGVAASVSEALVAHCASANDEQRRSALQRIVWEVACHLEQRGLGVLEDGRPVQSSLGFIALGSESAFEEPFVEHEGVLTAGRIALHEYVHAALERALPGEPHAA
jgi:hypothetical protein